MQRYRAVTTSANGLIRSSGVLIRIAPGLPNAQHNLRAARRIVRFMLLLGVAPLRVKRRIL